MFLGRRASLSIYSFSNAASKLEIDVFSFICIKDVLDQILNSRVVRWSDLRKVSLAG